MNELLPELPDVAKLNAVLNILDTSFKCNDLESGWFY